MLARDALEKAGEKEYNTGGSGGCGGGGAGGGGGGGGGVGGVRGGAGGCGEAYASTHGLGWGRMYAFRLGMFV